MYVKLVILYSVVICSQGVLSTNAQNNNGQFFYANPNARYINNPLLLTTTSETMPQLSLYQKQQYNLLNPARAQVPFNQNLKEQFMTYRQNNFVPNVQSIENKYRESFNQNFHQLGQELNNFPIKQIINRADSQNNEHVLVKNYNLGHVVRNTDLSSNNVNGRETASSLPKKPGSVAVVPRQDNIVTNFETEIKNNLLRINHQEGSKSLESDPSSRMILNENKNQIQPASKIRYIFVRKNGNVEYYDNLEMILKKYPHLNLKNSVPRLLQNSVKPKNYTFLPPENVKSVVNNTIFNANVPAIPYPKEQALVAPLQESFEVNKVRNYEKQNNSEQSSNLRDIDKKLNSQMSTHAPLQTIVDQSITNNRPVVDGNEKHLNINQIEHKSNTTETINTDPLNDRIPTIEKNNSNLLHFKQISNITIEDKTNANQTEKVKLAPAKLTTLSNLIKASDQDNLSNKREVNTENVTAKMEKVTVQNRSNLSDSQIVNKPASNITNTIVNEYSFNASKPSTFIEKITTTAAKSKKIGANDDHLLAKLANATESDKAITIVNTQDDTSLDYGSDDSKSEDYEEDYSSVSKPVLWVRTNDPEFWNKLVDDKDAYSFVYIINVKSQPKIEREKNRTIYANGTVIEEVTESIWEDGNDKPKVTKTIKVIPKAVNG